LDPAEKIPGLDLVFLAWPIHFAIEFPVKSISIKARETGVFDNEQERANPAGQRG
jgi:hypothetical protein